jgi:phage FluMu protein Com
MKSPSPKIAHIDFLWILTLKRPFEKEVTSMEEKHENTEYIARAARGDQKTVPLLPNDANELESPLRSSRDASCGITMGSGRVDSRR